MKDCFVVRFNLENMANSDAADRIGALSSLFSIERTELEESVRYYNERLKELAGTINKELANDSRKILSNKSIVFVGDSLTSDRLSYANIIKELNVFKKVDICAVSGIVSSQMIRYMKQRLVDKYDYISIFIGTNDSALTDEDLPFVSVSEYERNLLYTANFIKNNKANGIFFKIPVHKEKKYKNGLIISSDYNLVIEKIAYDNDIKLFDFNKTKLSYIEDNVHFSDITQRDIAVILLKDFLEDNK